ncbi:MAG: BACON domain-containing protein [Chitinophagaceae bacterium]
MFKIQMRLAFLLTSLILFLLSCRKHETQSSGSLTLSTNAISLDTTVNTQTTFTVQSTVSWTTSQVPDWLKLDVTSGVSGNTVVSVIAGSNNGTANARTANITFSPTGNSDIQPVTLTVTQRPYTFTLGFRKALGGQNFDGATYKIAMSPDGGTVIAGGTYSNDGDVHGNHGGADLWVIKLNAAGDTLWTKTYGGTLNDGASSIVATPDGGYAIIGSTESNDGDVHGNHGNGDLWLLKLNAAGDTVWTKTYGGSGNEGSGEIVTTSDGGYAISGYTTSTNIDIHDNHGSADMFLMKLTANGTLIWSKTYGGSDWEEPRSLITTSEGGFVLAGLTESNDKDVTGFHVPIFVGFDTWIVKVDGNGNKIWAHAYGGTFDDVAITIAATVGGYIITGYTNSNDGDITGYHGRASPIFYDMLVMKLDDNGKKLWVHAYGGTFDEFGLSVISTTDGGYVVAGGASSKNGDVSGYNGNGGELDMWIIKLDNSGNKQWGKTIGGSGDENWFSIEAIPGGFILTGLTDGKDGDMAGAGSHGDYDIWIGKLFVK